MKEAEEEIDDPAEFTENEDFMNKEDLQNIKKGSSGGGNKMTKTRSQKQSQSQ